MKQQPGPASTAEERSLRKISSKGTAVRSPPKEASFQTQLNSQYRFDGNPISNGFFQSRNLDLGRLLRLLHCTKGNAA